MTRVQIFSPSNALIKRWRAVWSDVDRLFSVGSSWLDCSKRSRIAWKFCFWDAVVLKSTEADPLSTHICSSWDREGDRSDFKRNVTEFHYVHFLLVNVQCQCPDLFVPLTTSWSALMVIWSCKSLVICCSRADLVDAGRAESSWKWSLSWSSSEDRKIRTVCHSLSKIKHSPGAR